MPLRCLKRGGNFLRNNRGDKDSSFFIDQIKGRYPFYMEVCTYLGILLACRVKELDSAKTVVLYKLAQSVKVPVKGHGYKDNLFRVSICHHCLKLRDFCPAVRAPRCPKNQHNLLPAEITEFMRLSIKVIECEVRYFITGLYQFRCILCIKVLLLLGISN